MQIILDVADKNSIAATDGDVAHIVCVVLCLVLVLLKRINCIARMEAYKNSAMYHHRETIKSN